MSTRPVIIIGAGLTGMSAALFLRRAGIEYRIVELSDHPGGLVVTNEEQGFRFDVTGHLLHLRDPQMRELVTPWLGSDVRTVRRHSMVWSHGRYTRYPYQANTFGLPPDIAYECLMGFLKAREKPIIETPRNFQEFSLKHFGEGFSKHFMIPYNARLWGVDPKDITAQWCQRFVPIPKLEDVIAGAVGLNDRELGYNTEFLYPATGIGELSKNMAREVPAIEYETGVSSIDTSSRTVELTTGETIEYAALISTMPLDRLMALLKDAPQEVSSASSHLRCNKLYYLDVALDVPVGWPYHWVYVPEERYPFYRVGCYSNFSEKMAPEGKSCLYIELADRSAPDLKRLVPQVAENLVEMNVITKTSEVLFASLRTIEHAYVIFDHAYYDTTQTIQTFLENNHILSTGRYGGWNYSSMEDALLFGRDAANRVRELLS